MLFLNIMEINISFDQSYRLVKNNDYNSFSREVYLDKVNCIYINQPRKMIIVDIF